jgi:hypothetical protein
VDAGGTPVPDGDGHPVKGIVPLRQDEADALARARRDVPGGAAAGGIARDWDTRGIFAPAGKRWRGCEAGRVLRRARNAGLMEYRGGITGTARWPAVVDEDHLAGGGRETGRSEPRDRPGTGEGAPADLAGSLRAVRGPCGLCEHEQGCREGT